MERICKRCGRVYRGLVCQACHPRKGKAAEAPGGQEAGTPVAQNAAIENPAAQAPPVVLAVDRADGA